MANTYVPTSGLAGVAVLETPSTTQKFALGTQVQCAGTTFHYVKSGEAISQYMAVAIDEDWLAKKVTLALADADHKFGAAQVAFSASNYYGWVATQGSNFSVLVRASCAADAALFTTSSAGVLDDATTSGVLTGIVVVTSATSSGTQAEEALANFPLMA